MSVLGQFLHLHTVDQCSNDPMMPHNVIAGVLAERLGWETTALAMASLAAQPDPMARQVRSGHGQRHSLQRNPPDPLTAGHHAGRKRSRVNVRGRE